MEIFHQKVKLCLLLDLSNLQSGYVSKLAKIYGEDVISKQEMAAIQPIILRTAFQHDVLHCKCAANSFIYSVTLHTRYLNSCVDF